MYCSSLNTTLLHPLFIEADCRLQQTRLQLAEDSHKTYPSGLLVKHAEPISIHAESFSILAGSLSKHAEPISKLAEPISKLAGSFSKHAEPISKCAESFSKLAGSFSKLAGSFSKHAESFSKHAESFSKHAESFSKKDISSQTTENQCGAKALTPSVGHRLKRVINAP